MGRKGKSERSDGEELGAASTEEAERNSWRKREAESNPGGELEGTQGRTCFPGLRKECRAGLGKHQRRSGDTSVKDN